MKKLHRKMEVISTFEIKDNVISINLNKSKICCLYSLKVTLYFIIRTIFLLD